MGKVTRREWYRRVNAAWPPSVPALTADEATRAARKLYRFVTRQTFRGHVRVSSGNRYTKVYANEIVVNPDKGWHALVHSMSHWLEAYAGTQGTHGHTAAHARLELRMIKEVVRRGWLDGALRTPEPMAVVAPTPIDAAHARAAGLERRLARWHTKRKRAETAIRKLTRQLRAIERRAAKLAELAGFATRAAGDMGDVAADLAA